MRSGGATNVNNLQAMGVFVVKLKIALLSTVVLGTAGAAFAQFAPQAPVSGLTPADARNIFSSCQKAAAATPSKFGRKNGTIMWCAVLDREGTTLLIKATDTGESPGPILNTDAWRASIEIAEAKAYTALSVSSNDLALDSRTVGLATRPDGGGSGPVGTDTGPAPLWGLGNTNPFRHAVGDPSLHPDDKVGAKHHGIVTFAGGQPVYRCNTGKLVGGVGVSGDGVDEDDAVAIGAILGAQPPGTFGINPSCTSPAAATLKRK